MGVKLRMSSAYHPQTDGATERANRTVTQMLRQCINPNQKDWVSKLPAIQFAINSARSESTGYSPFFLNTGRMPRAMIWNAATPMCHVKVSLPTIWRALTREGFTMKKVCGCYVYFIIIQAFNIGFLDYKNCVRAKWISTKWIHLLNGSQLLTWSTCLCWWKRFSTAEYHFEDMHELLRGNEPLGNVSLFGEKGTSTIYYHKDYTDIKLETDILFCLRCHSMAYYTQT